MSEDLKRGIHNASASLNAAQTVKVDALAAAHMPGDLALLVIDVQQRYCDCKTSYCATAQTDERAGLIQSIVPEFRKAGVPVYAVHFSMEDEVSDFYKFKPEPEDTLVRKSTMSAFKSGSAKQVLKEDDRKVLIVCGVYTSQCVKNTVLDAVFWGYKVCLLEDMTADYDGSWDTYESLQEMRAAGVEVAQSADVLPRVRALKSVP